MSKSKYDYFLVQGRSMLPTIESNLNVKILKTKDVKVGDIIVFRISSFKRKKDKNIRIIHRVVKFDQNKIICKGDNRFNCDNPITSKEILGKVIKVGNKRVDSLYYNLINPILARTSYYSMKFNPSYNKLRLIPRYLQNIKIKLIGDKDLKIEKTMFFFISFPYKINKGILRLLKR